MCQLRKGAIVVLALLVSGIPLAGCRTALDPVVIADAQTAARVKTALVNDPTIGEFAIEVRVTRGVAVLSGGVPAQTDATRALELARAVPGVTEVRSDLRVGSDAQAPPGPIDRAAPAIDSREIDSAPRLLAVGIAAGWSVPRATALKTRLAFSPLFKLGSPRGLAPAIGFDWFQADVASTDGVVPTARVHVKPIMLGAGYTLTTARFSLTPSVVGGYAFNSLTITDVGTAHGLPVEVANSVVWRAGVSAWHDLTARTAVNASVGYLKTGLRLTVLEGGRLVERPVRGDTAVVHVGLVYRVF